MSKAIAFILLILSVPLFLVLFIVVELDSPGAFIFSQKRVGKNKRIFTIYKIRTMIKNAEQLKSKYIKLNESDGPIFKIKNDPRFTRVGKLLAHSAIDELPQMINIVKGDMDFVGPRPLLVSDVKNLPQKYDERFKVLPGLTSPWVVQGQYKMTFTEWMNLDVKYTKNKTAVGDVTIFLLTLKLLIKSFFNV